MSMLAQHLRCGADAESIGGVDGVHRVASREVVLSSLALDL